MNTKKIVLAVILLGLALAAVWAYNAILGEPEQATGPIEAIPLEITAQALATQTALPATEVSEMPASTPTTIPDLPVMVEPSPTVESPENAGNSLIIFQLDQAESQVRFSLDEDLNGQRITVVGSTDQVAGELAINLADLSTAQMGIIQVNARTLLTDQNRRNNAIRNFILDTNSYEFITFTPTEIRGMPASAQIGETVTFQIVGDLTIRHITQSVTFDVSATVSSSNRLEGLASATIQRANYELNIPSVPNVANVEEEVLLEIEFVALAK